MKNTNRTTYRPHLAERLLSHIALAAMGSAIYLFLQVWDVLP
ncbi:hypothetical protein [Hymenobacter crusticola]|nr:hypothetical protein [Hymenobacter crusticola]